MTQHWDDIVVRCHHGETADFVQRYRWMTSQGVWVPVDSTGESNTWVGTDQRPVRTPEDVAAVVASGRQQIGAYCKECPNKVPMTYHGAQAALTRLAGMCQMDVPMLVLRHAYNEVPKQLR